MKKGTLTFEDPRWADPTHDITEDDAEGMVFDRFRARLEHGLQFGRAASVFPVPNEEEQKTRFYLSQEDAENGVGCVAEWNAERTPCRFHDDAFETCGGDCTFEDVYCTECGEKLLAFRGACPACPPSKDSEEPTDCATCGGDEFLRCATCDGTGMGWGAGSRGCTECKGSGDVPCGCTGYVSPREYAEVMADLLYEQDKDRRLEEEWDRA